MRRTDFGMFVLLNSFMNSVSFDVVILGFVIVILFTYLLIRKSKKRSGNHDLGQMNKASRESKELKRMLPQMNVCPICGEPLEFVEDESFERRLTCLKCY